MSIAMLFFARSALCIGLVASALPSRPPAASFGSDAVPAGAAALARACGATAACGGLARTLLSSEPGGARAGKLRDQLPAGRARLPRPAEVL